MRKHVVLAFLVSAGLASIVHAQPGGSQTQSIGGAASDSVGTAPPPVAPVPIPYPNAIQGSAPVNRASPGVVTVQPLPAVRNAPPPPPQPAWPSKIEGPTGLDTLPAR
ncbi:MAG TPA: hypothetical protein VFZ84_16775 [Burkholderiales bacterium]